MYGHKFLKTRVDQLCSDSSFRVAMLKTCRAKRDCMKKEKTAQKAAKEIAKEARAILDNPPPIRLCCYITEYQERIMRKQLVRQKSST